MRMIATTIAALALCVTPAEATRAALTDCQSLQPQWRPQMRWVVCETPEQQIAVTYLLNSVSRSRVIYKPKRVNGTERGKALLRIDLAAYANQRDANSYKQLHAAWEVLAANDSYFHVRTQVAIAGKKDAQTVTIDGGWVGLENAAALRAATGSAGAVLRADYFVARVSTEDYYSWSGTASTQAEFLTSLGVDKGVIEKLAADTAANLFKSNITHKPRRVVRLPGPLGSIWITLDVDGESPDRDPIRNPVDVDGPQGKQRYNFQASEIFYTRANGFWGTVLFDSTGKRQDSVPDRVAKDTESPDGIVRPLLSCIRCHELHGKGGLQPFTDDQHPLLTGEAAILKSYLPEVAQRVSELYDPSRLDREIERDREDYSKAVQAATHVSTAAAAQALAGTVARYADEGVELARAASEAGVDVDVFVERTKDSTDPITLAIRAGKQVTRKAFEASYQDIMVRVAK